MIDSITTWFRSSADAQRRMVESQAESILAAAELIAGAFVDNKKLLIFGNGGSAADAQHVAAEFINRFRIERPPLPAIALSTDTSIITSIGNDYSFDDIFLKQIKALGNPGDVTLAISTSGNSKNVIKAVEEAASKSIKTIGLAGRDGGKLAPLCDIALLAPTNVTAQVQECHLITEHVICELVDKILFGPM